MALSKTTSFHKATLYRDVAGNICLDVHRNVTVNDSGQLVATSSVTADEYTATLTATQQTQLQSILETLEA